MHTYECTTTEAFPKIVEMLQSQPVQKSRAGDTKEHLSVTVQSQNPRDRLFLRDGYNVAFQLQEAIAYWTGQNPGHVERYNPKMKQYMTNGKLEGSAYGRYLRHKPHDQISRVIDQLRENSETRQAVVNFHQAGVERYSGPDVACTVYLQFMIRNGQLHCFTSMRSQDMHWGYPYDVHNFQWIQEVLAGILDVKLGTYTHQMNSCHYYTEREDQVREAVETMEPIRFPDIRLDDNELAFVMRHLFDGLQSARNGRMPTDHIEQIEEESGFYADWLRFMTVYEQRRFHDGEAQSLVEQIEFSQLFH